MSSLSSIIGQCPYRTRLSVVMKIHQLKRCPLSKSNIFYQNFMKLGHIVKYRDVFFQFDNGPYGTMLKQLWPFVYENSPF